MTSLVLSRSLHVLHHLQLNLDIIAPNHHDFLKYREQIITQGTSSELKELLDIEEKLHDEKATLVNRIQRVKDNAKKKEFAVATSKLLVVEKKLTETSKQLNHRLMESAHVNANLHKMLDDISWIKQRLDEKDVRLILDSDGLEPVLDTTIQKKEKMIALEYKLNNSISNMKKETEELSKEENDLAMLQQRIEQTKKELARYQDDKDPDLTRRHRDMIVRRESTHRLYAHEMRVLEETIGEWNVM